MQTLNQFTLATSIPQIFSLLFVRDGDLASPQSRAFEIWRLVSAVATGLTVQDATITDPTALTPSKGQAWIVNGTGGGGWVSQDNTVAIWDGTVWVHLTPSEGWRFHSKAQNRDYVFNGSAWAQDFLTPSLTSTLAGDRLRLDSAGTAPEWASGPKSGTGSIADTNSETAIGFSTAFPSANYTPMVIGEAGVSLFRIKSGTIATTGFTVERVDTALQALETSGAETFHWIAIPHEDL